MREISPGRRRQRRGIHGQTVTIGVQGTGQRVGTTHFTILLATYLAAVRGLRVAIAGLSDTDGLRQADKIHDSLCSGKGGKRLFTMYGQSGEDLVMDLLRLQGDERYDVVLIDCGDANDTRGDAPGQRMFRYCNHRYIVANLSWWRLAECADYLERSRNGQQGSDFREMVGFPVVPQAAAYVKKEYGVRVRELPYEPDPYCLHEGSLEFCESIYHSL